LLEVFWGTPFGAKYPLAIINPTKIPIPNNKTSGALFFESNTAIIATAGAIPNIAFLGIIILSCFFINNPHKPDYLNLIQSNTYIFKLHLKTMPISIIYFLLIIISITLLAAGTKKKNKTLIISGTILAAILILVLFLFRMSNM